MSCSGGNISPFCITKLDLQNKQRFYLAMIAVLSYERIDCVTLVLAHLDKINQEQWIESMVSSVG